ncbi:hypothetical protein WICMUC_002595 [Wickerhamomyces mucosus]|uniref:BAG domain-containing protein n=1 Tax=Wickerhamomyces mucosus TaxID=1378264 RepID=A0A9P8TDN9_9ASCO|nr:hypothetical protein WICMUC_002595 [Wickerhamomyces mucosus]
MAETANAILVSIVTLSTVVLTSCLFVYLTLPKQSKEFTKLNKQLKDIYPLIINFKTDVETYYQVKYKEDNEEDRKYRYNYYQEESLKILIKIDGVDLADLENDEEKKQLKTKRKDFIKKIQNTIKNIEQYK